MQSPRQSQLLCFGFWLYCISSTWGVEVTPAGIIPPYRLVRVKLDVGERAWIISSTFEPVDTEQYQQLIVWTGPPGRYAILSWTETGQSQTFVEIGDSGPGPTPPPDPDPPEPPEPDPQPPAKVLNDFGIGKVAYEKAVLVRRPLEAAELGQTTRQALAGISQGRLTPAGAEALIRTKRKSFTGDWAPWETAVEEALSKAISQWGGGALQYRNYLIEIATGLEAAQ